mgnify:CR=1 FL=1
MQGVDIQAGVGLVEQRQLRLHQQHLHDFVALFLAAGKAFVDAALKELRVQVHLLAGFAGLAQQGHRIPLFLALGLAGGFQRRLEEFHVGHTGDLHRVLERQEQTQLGALLGLQIGQALALEQGVAAGDLVVVLAGQHIGQRRFAGAVGAHDGVYLTGVHGQVQALENGFAGYGGVQITNFQHV